MGYVFIYFNPVKKNRHRPDFTNARIFFFWKKDMGGAFLSVYKGYYLVTTLLNLVTWDVHKTDHKAN